MLKFTQKKVSALSGLTEVQFTETTTAESRPHDHFLIIADQRGVRMQGRSPVISDRGELNEYAKTIAEAWNEHRKLIPQIDLLS